MNRCPKTQSSPAPSTASKQACGTTTDCIIHQVSDIVAFFILNTATTPPANDNTSSPIERIVGVTCATCRPTRPANNPAPPVVTRLNQRSPAEYRFKTHPIANPTSSPS